MKISDRDLKLSRFISLILRHKPETINIKLDNKGYAKVDELIKGINKNSNDMTINDLERIVSEDDKQRYSFNEDKTMIKANQGHSIKVDLTLKPIKPPKLLYHGTGEKYLKSILKQGINKRNRQYVHLSDNVDVAIEAGERHGVPCVLCIESKQMYEDGYIFYLSDNGVWLTDYVPERYIGNYVQKEWVGM